MVIPVAPPVSADDAVKDEAARLASESEGQRTALSGSSGNTGDPVKDVASSMTDEHEKVGDEIRRASYRSGSTGNAIYDAASAITEEHERVANEARRYSKSKRSGSSSNTIQEAASSITVEHERIANEARGNISKGKSVLLAENNMDIPAHQSLYAQGIKIRKQVVGEDYVENALEKGKTDFLRPLQQFATESAWGTIWTRPGLSLRDRSLLNLVMLTALSKWVELGTHVRGAVRNGCTEVEIREALLQASAYCGLPAGMEAFRVADATLNKMAEKGEIVRG